MDEGTLSFIVKDQYLGVAFRGLKGQKLFPIVNVVWGNCEVTMTYIGGLKREHFTTTTLSKIHCLIKPYYYSWTNFADGTMQIYHQGKNW